MIVGVYTVDSGALAFAVYVLESVDCMKLAIYYSVTTSLKSPSLPTVCTTVIVVGYKVVETNVL